MWSAIETGTEDEEDCTAIEAILSAVPHEYVESLGSKDSAEAAWDALKAMRVGSDRAKKAMAFRDDERALRLQPLVSQLATLGVTITDEEAVAMYLRWCPPSTRRSRSTLRR